ncbi:hypothetical protein GCM10020001_000470 [Nonomuraea salmonea]
MRRYGASTAPRDPPARPVEAAWHPEGEDRRGEGGGGQVERHQQAGQGRDAELLGDRGAAERFRVIYHDVGRLGGERRLVVEHPAQHRLDRAGGGDGGAHALPADGVLQPQHLVVQRRELHAMGGGERRETARRRQQRPVPGGPQPEGQREVRLHVATAAHGDE